MYNHKSRTGVLQNKHPQQYPILSCKTNTTSIHAEYREPLAQSFPPLNYWDNFHAEQFIYTPAEDPGLTQIRSLNSQLTPNDYDFGNIGRNTFLKYLIVRGEISTDIITGGLAYHNIPAAVRVTCILDTNRVIGTPTTYADIYANVAFQGTPIPILPKCYFNTAQRNRFIPLFDFIVDIDQYQPGHQYEYIVDLQDFKAIYNFDTPRLGVLPVTGSLHLVYFSDRAPTDTQLVQHSFISRVAYYSK